MDFTYFFPFATTHLKNCSTDIFYLQIHKNLQKMLSELLKTTIKEALIFKIQKTPRFYDFLGSWNKLFGALLSCYKARSYVN